MKYDLVVIGGGAAGYFGAIQCVEKALHARVLILEKSSDVLRKVKISGGGRCNVTHACFDPAEMIANYPRGDKEMLGPFHKFLCGDMMAWLSENDVETKIEDDGRVFPMSNSSKSIIDCFTNLCSQYQIIINKSCAVLNLTKKNGHWHIKTFSENFIASNILMATGSSPAAWEMIGNLGHKIISPVPSLFTFNIKSKLIDGIAGISVPQAEVKIKDQIFNEVGPLLITHWGLSGPAILKLSARAARVLNDSIYQFEIEVNWVGLDNEYVNQEIQTIRKTQGKRAILKLPLLNIPKRLWQKMIYGLRLINTNYADLKSVQINAMVKMICQCEFTVRGKSIFKDEFVTCGGVDTKEINFKTMESKLHPNLFFAGEVINIDAITGGFNFQAAWTTAYIAANSIAQELD